jgi:hypothetical protein
VEAISRGAPGAIGVRIEVACDKASWLAGYAEGAGQEKACAVVNNIRHHSGGAAYRSDWSGVGTVGFSQGFMQGMRLAARHSWRHDEPRPIGV